MQRKSLVKLGFAVLIAVAAMIGIDPVPASADDCPSEYGDCVLSGMTCDQFGCCYDYYNIAHPQDACPSCCDY